jgi:hypothetical protein
MRNDAILNSRRFAVDPPVSKLDRIMIRLPDGMRPLLERRAHENRRSMSSETVCLIERGLAAEKMASGQA